MPRRNARSARLMYHARRGYAFPVSSRTTWRRKVREYGESYNQVEIKRRTTTTETESPILNAGILISPIGLIPQGLNHDERIGNRISVRNVNFRFFFHDTTTTTPSWFRIMIFWGNGVVPTAANIVAQFTATTNGQMIPWRPQIQNLTAGDFTMNCLYDQSFPMFGLENNLQQQFHLTIRVPVFRAAVWNPPDITGVNPGEGWLICFITSTRNDSMFNYQMQQDTYFTDL